MRECWINIYVNPDPERPYVMGAFHKSLSLAVYCPKTGKPAYRIHVKLKDLTP